MGLNCTPISKVMAVWIGPELLRSIPSVSIYYVPESDIRVKSYDHLNFSRTSIFQFLAARYIIGLNRTPLSKVMPFELDQSFRVQFWASLYILFLNLTFEWKVMTIWISWEHPLFYLFLASRYIMGLNHTPMSKVMAVWIGPELQYSISNVSIYYVSESNIRVKKFCHLNF